VREEDDDGEHVAWVGSSHVAQGNVKFDQLKRSQGARSQSSSKLLKSNAFFPGIFAQHCSSVCYEAHSYRDKGWRRSNNGSSWSTFQDFSSHRTNTTSTRANRQF